MSTQGRKNFSNINIDVPVPGCEVARIATMGIASMKKDEYHVWVRFDDWLHMNRRRQREDDIRITEPSVKLN